jgi:hypothetical protein
MSATFVMSAPLMANRSHCFPQMLKPDESLSIAPAYSYRSATIGSTFVARCAGSDSKPQKPRWSCTRL